MINASWSRLVKNVHAFTQRYNYGSIERFENERITMTMKILFFVLSAFDDIVVARGRAEGDLRFVVRFAS